MPYGRAVTLRLSEAVTRILREYTTEMFISQSELARRSGVSQPHISNVFNGKSAFSVDQLDAICQSIGVQVAAVMHEAEQLRSR